MGGLGTLVLLNKIFALFSVHSTWIFHEKLTGLRVGHYFSP